MDGRFIFEYDALLMTVSEGNVRIVAIYVYALNKATIETLFAMDSNDG